MEFTKDFLNGSSEHVLQEKEGAWGDMKVEGGADRTIASCADVLI